jgi:alkylresorcinol/alkylpyrone synthase
MSPFTQRAHIGDTGCAAAMVAVQAAWNHLRAFPDHRAVAASVEICSAALYRDGTAEAALGEAIFADGSGAVCLTCEGAGFEILGHKTVIRSEHIGLTGFEFPGGARRLVLSKDLPAVGAEVLADLAGALLQEHGLKQSDIRFWIVHSAGRKVLDRAQRRLGLDEQDLHFSREVFRKYGNMSSATVLFVLEEVMTSGRPQPGDLALMAAMGAGFAAEGALLRWAP